MLLVLLIINACKWIPEDMVPKGATDKNGRRLDIEARIEWCDICQKVLYMRKRGGLFRSMLHGA